MGYLMKFNRDMFEDNVVSYLRDHPGMRYGQVLFTVMYYMYPEIANYFRGSWCDPYHNDKMAVVFLDACAHKIERD